MYVNKGQNLPELQLLHDWKDLLAAALIPRQVQTGDVLEVQCQIVGCQGRHSRCHMPDICIDYCTPRPARGSDWQQAVDGTGGSCIVPVAQQLLVNSAQQLRWQILPPAGAGLPVAQADCVHSSMELPWLMNTHTEQANDGQISNNSRGRGHQVG